MRVDAQRNHDQILDAARELFATEGTKVPVESIAKAAGVGVGTVARHFPTKEELIDAVVLRFCEPITDSLDAALAAADPAEGLESFLVTTVDYLAANRALSEEMRDMHDRLRELPELTEFKDRMLDQLVELLDRAQSTGRVRADVTVDDLRMMMVGLAQTASHAGDDLSPAGQARFVRLWMDGIRIGEHRPL